MVQAISSPIASTASMATAARFDGHSDPDLGEFPARIGVGGFVTKIHMTACLYAPGYCMISQMVLEKDGKTWTNFGEARAILVDVRNLVVYAAANATPCPKASMDPEYYSAGRFPSDSDRIEDC
jgi:hypothetical protein